MQYKFCVNFVIVTDGFYYLSIYIYVDKEILKMLYIYFFITVYIYSAEYYDTKYIFINYCILISNVMYFYVQ